MTNKLIKKYLVNSHLTPQLVKEGINREYQPFSTLRNVQPFFQFILKDLTSVNTHLEILKVSAIPPLIPENSDLSHSFTFLGFVIYSQNQACKT